MGTPKLTEHGYKVPLFLNGKPLDHNSYLKVSALPKPPSANTDSPYGPTHACATLYILLGLLYLATTNIINDGMPAVGACTDIHCISILALHITMISYTISIPYTTNRNLLENICTVFGIGLGLVYICT
jgi:hypothetical protein